MQKELNVNKFGNRGLIACIVALILIPITLFVAWTYFDRNYFVTSLLIIVYTMIPFFVMFEKRKPQAPKLPETDLHAQPIEFDWSSPVDTDMSFEDKLNKFKQASDEKMHDIKRNLESKRGSGKSKGGY